MLFQLSYIPKIKISLLRTGVLKQRNSSSKLNWLRIMDSNHFYKNQNLVCCHYTNPQCSGGINRPPRFYIQGVEMKRLFCCLMIKCKIIVVKLKSYENFSDDGSPRTDVLFLPLRTYVPNTCSSDPRKPLNGYCISACLSLISK